MIKRGKEFNRKTPLTVCIAAICHNSIIVGASDRMMTSGDIEFEPDFSALPNPVLSPGINETYTASSKIIPLTPSIAIMTAGDAGLQREIMNDVISAMAADLVAKPTHFHTVKEVLSIYLHFYDKAKGLRAQTEIFSPLGISAKTFISEQKELSKEFVEEVMEKINKFELSFRADHGIATLIVGIDINDELNIPHIYSIHRTSAGDSVECCDSIGFAAIGIGGRHAESQFMLAGHNRYATHASTILLTYLAKKRSEIAPGVGKDTDMFAIGPGRGQFAMLDRVNDFNFGKLDELYQKVKDKEAETIKQANEEMQQYLTEFFKRKNAKENPGEASPPAEHKEEK